VIGLSHSLHAAEQDCVAGKDGYCLLSPLPLTDLSAQSPTYATTPEQYIKGIVRLMIGLAGVFAVLQLIIAGMKYVTVDSFSGKDTARKDINNALIGLILAIGAFTILQTISTQFTNLTLNVQNVGSTDSLTLCSATNPDILIVDGKCTCKDTKKILVGGLCLDNAESTADAAAVGCTNGCVAASTFDFPQKGPDSGGCIGKTCYVNQILGQRLAALEILMHDNDHLKWQVTELFPPSGTHTSGCHAPGDKAGSCVDASLDGNNRNPAQILKFLKDIKGAVGPSFQYELPTTAACFALKNNSLLDEYKNYFVWNSALQGGEHVHINLTGEAKQDTPCTVDTSKEN
jgi:hypothetical protein